MSQGIPTIGVQPLSPSQTAVMNVYAIHVANTNAVIMRSLRLVLRAGHSFLARSLRSRRAPRRDFGL